MGHPAKEGLRQSLTHFVCFISDTPRVGHPAKEGLRPAICAVISTEAQPRVGHPAKEGLRLATKVLPFFSICTQSGSSSKRGIKTLKQKTINSSIEGPEWVIQQKRD